MIRADGHEVKIGADFHLGDEATVHIAHDRFATRIGDGVSAGRNAVIHACDVSDGCAVGENTIILDGSRIGPGAILAPDAIVFPGKTLEGGWFYEGRPAKPVREVAAEELQNCHERIHAGREMPVTTERAVLRHPKTCEDFFVAPSARLAGEVEIGRNVGIWYACRLDAGLHRIKIGQGTNVQDNTRIHCRDASVIIEPDVTIGHNVTLIDCRVKSGSLVGIGAHLAPGTVVERDVLVAAGAVSEPGQRLTSGQLWAGNPARPIAELDDHKYSILNETLPVYQSYARQFSSAEHRVYCP